MYVMSIHFDIFLTNFCLKFILNYVKPSNIGLINEKKIGEKEQMKAA